MTKYQSLLVHAKRNRKSVSQVYKELTAEQVAEVVDEEPVEKDNSESEPESAVADPEVSDEDSNRAEYEGMSKG